MVRVKFILLVVVLLATSVANVVKLVTWCKSSGIFELECSLSHQGVLCGCMFCKELSSCCLYILIPPTLQVY
jgi:hypothetical protein